MTRYLPVCVMLIALVLLASCAAPAPAPSGMHTTTPTPMPPTFEELREEAQILGYQELFRNIEDYTGQSVYFRARVNQALEQRNGYLLRVYIAGSSSDLLVDYFGSTRILEDDDVEFVATVNGLQSYETIFGAQRTIPRLDAGTNLRLWEPATSMAPTPSAEGTPPTISPGNTPAPTATPTPRPIPEPIVVQGSGDTLTQSFELGAGLITFDVEYTGDRNFIVSLHDEHGRSESLTNVIGSYSGVRAVQVSTEGSFSLRPGDFRLEVRASGPWSFTIRQPWWRHDEPSLIEWSGYGDSVIAPIQLTAGLTPVQLTHDGSRNFIVRLMSQDGDAAEGVANEIGSYQGTKGVSVRTSGFGLNPGVYALVIQADGNWTVRLGD